MSFACHLEPNVCLNINVCNMCHRQKICVLVFLIGQDTIMERTKETSLNISLTCIPSTTIAGVGQHSFHRMYAYPPNSDLMLGQHCSPLLVRCRSIVYDAGPTLIYHRVCYILCKNTWYSNNAVSMLTHRHWKSIGWLYRVSDGCFMLVTLQHPGARNNR